MPKIQLIGTMVAYYSIPADRPKNACPYPTSKDIRGSARYSVFSIRIRRSHDYFVIIIAIPMPVPTVFIFTQDPVMPHLPTTISSQDFFSCSLQTCFNQTRNWKRNGSVDPIQHKLHNPQGCPGCSCVLQCESLDVMKRFICCYYKNTLEAK